MFKIVTSLTLTVCIKLMKAESRTGSYSDIMTGICKARRIAGDTAELFFIISLPDISVKMSLTYLNELGSRVFFIPLNCLYIHRCKDTSNILILQKDFYISKLFIIFTRNLLNIYGVLLVVISCISIFWVALSGHPFL